MEGQRIKLTLPEFESVVLEKQDLKCNAYSAIVGMLTHSSQQLLKANHIKLYKCLIGILETNREKKYLVAVEMFSLSLFNHIFCEALKKKLMVASRF